MGTAMINQFSGTWTKFVTTVGPSSSTEEVIEGLVRNGSDMLRNNFAHAQYDEYAARYNMLQDINKRLGASTGMQADLQGPNIRVGILPDEGIPLNADTEYVFYTNVGEPESTSEILINDNSLHLDVKAGEPITFMDGAIEATITWVKGHRLGVKITNSGILMSRKSVNVPETNLSSPALTEKDYRDLEFLLTKAPGIDYIALSFVDSRKELDEVRAMIGNRNIKLISKIERRRAISNVQEIIDASDIVMIARGDLGIEMPFEDIPVLQREITDRCRYSNKAVITATQMMISMAKAKRPTRAEVSDVANAVFAGSDAVMLSEETAQSVDPVNSLQTMVKIVRRSEQYMYHRTNGFDL
jgi:pyruvate kinase